MKLIVDIPDWYYRDVHEFKHPNFVDKAIMDGVPLPKGHGRLIDADALEKLCYEHEIGNDAFDGKPIIAQGQYDDGNNIWKSLFDFAPTIIEADKEDKV